MALGLALVGQAELQLLDGLHELFLGLDPGRLVAAAARGGGRVVLRAVGQQAVGQGAAGGRRALGVGAGGRGREQLFDMWWKPIQLQHIKIKIKWRINPCSLVRMEQTFKNLYSFNSILSFSI